MPRVRPALAAIGFIAAASVYGASLGGQSAAWGNVLFEQTDAAAAHLGFRIDTVTFDGVAEVTEGELLALLGDGQPSSLTHYGTERAKAALLSHPWIAHAELQRLFPARLHVTVRERRPVALLQGETLNVIDAQGRDLGILVDPTYAGLPVLAGEGASQVTADVTALFDAVRGLPSNPRGAVRVSGRRWDVVLASGVTLRLPAEDIPAAMGRLRRAAGTALNDWILGDGAADRVIDLRHANHISLASRAAPVDTSVDLALAEGNAS